MIVIEIHDPDRGASQEFADEATAIVWLQDEIGRWERVFGKNIDLSDNAVCAPLNNWRAIKSRVDNKENIYAQKPG